MRRALLLLALTAGSAASAWAGIGPTAAAAAPAAPAVSAPPSRGQVAGMAVPDVSGPNAASDLAHLKADGINTVSLFVWWLAPSRTGDTLTPYSGTTGDDALTTEIGAARRLGLAVTLTPLFYCADCEGGWRGTMAPADMDGFFRSYGAFIDHYARLAAAQGVGTLYVGSEMTSLETEATHWRSLIAAVRADFHGTIAYEENWDVAGRAPFLSDVDLIGISAYFPLDDAPAPTLSHLLADWSSSQASAAYGSDWVSKLDHLAASTGKPIAFGEAGYMSGDYAAKQPFLNFEGQPDWQLQSDLYQALLETFSSRSWWAGAVWWEWGKADGLIADSGRSPGGKTAEILLKRWYAEGARPARPDVPLVVAGSSLSTESAATPATVGTSGSGQDAAGPSGSTSPTGALDAAQQAGLVGLLVFLAALALLCWVTLGRAPPAAPTALATPRPRSGDRGP